MLAKSTATKPPLLGVVGPACTVAAMYGDGVQAEAVAASVSARSLPHCILIIHLEHLPKVCMHGGDCEAAYEQCDYYLHNGTLCIEFGQQHQQSNLQMEVLHSGYNSSVDVSQLDSILSSLQPLDFVILVVNPQEARDIWPVSFSQKRLEFPWWYFGTDRVTAFGPADEFETDGRSWAAMVDVASGDLWFILFSERWCMMMHVTDPTLVRALVAEIGLSPYRMYPRP
ncbi:unnamed protein product [Sphagnum troendelagicum]|uniref:Uncharacterized protein n=1 Tax=Sphagnum troendelagicum TaxID=128251 RepID=A0ABP0TSS4_9BRYO